MELLKGSLLKQHKELMTSLVKKHEIIKDLIGEKQVSYLDIPVHDNIGDLLIMHGTLKFFKNYNINVVNILSEHSFHKNAINKEDVIVFHGGGNLGDLYKNLQAFKEEIIKKHISNRIIIMPQTIYFESDENYKKCCQIFRQHKDLHICVRDKASYKLAQQMSDYVYLLPDMAHQLYPIKSIDTQKEQKLLIKRLDGESLVSLNGAKFEGMYTTDWHILIRKYRRRTRLIRKLFKLSNRLHLNKYFAAYLAKLWIEHSQILVDEAILLFSKYDEIFTDRLHAHILSCLMDKKHTVYDNSYGKNINYIQCWTVDSPLVTIGEANE